ncbi:MAG TPA: PilZ domain-containing protein [Gemmataceae bacterium]|nr:PilZ domain-containing protein [Gemmataceae bacterium]
MSNQRNDYRHDFAPDDRLRVELSWVGGAAFAVGQIVNLSVSGLACVVEGDSHLDRGRRVVAHFAIPHGLRRFAISCEVMYAGTGQESDPIRLRFLPLATPSAQEERDKALWVFLLDEQRRDRRLRRWMGD